MSPGDTPRRNAMLLLALGAVSGLIARVWFAFTDDGLLWPDEYYQSLEPAHRAVFGYGWQAWEFLEGARHWTLPGLIAAVMKLSGAQYLAAVELMFCLAGVATGFAVYALARAQAADPLHAAVGAVAFWCMGFAVYCAPRAMGETLSALPVTLAFALLLSSPQRWKLLLAGALLSLAVGLRLQNGIFCLGALWLVWRQRSGLGWLLASLVAGALVYGGIDWLTWGRPFHSALVYLRFNVLEGKSSDFGTAPVFFYAARLVTAEGLTVVPLVALAVRSWAVRREVLWVSLAFLLVHSFIPHKELRFIFPLLPLLAAQAAVGLTRAPRWAMGAVVALSLASLATFQTLTFGRLGISNPPRELSALDYMGAPNRLLKRATTQNDLCGLKLFDLENWRTGGYAYLHQRVPMYRRDQSAEGRYNYALAKQGTLAGEIVASEDDFVLLKLPVSGCAPDPTYDFHLE